MPYKRARSYSTAAFRKYKRSRTWKPTRFARRPRRGTRYGGKSRMMRNIALNLSEAKENNLNLPFTGGSGTASWNGYHDNLYGCNLHDAVNNQGATKLPANGSLTNGRNGKEIYATGFRIRGSFTVPYDRRNTRIKMWLVEWNTAQGSPVTYANFFENTVGNGMVDPINNERFPGIRKLRDMRVKARDLYVERGEITDDGSEATMYYNIWIPFKRKLFFRDGSTEMTPISGIKEYLTMIMLPYDTPDTNSTTDRVVTQHEQCVTFYWRDP